VSLFRSLKSPEGITGLILLLLVIAVAFLGPVFAPYAVDQTIGPPAQLPGPEAILGTDVLGRDVYSRLLYGGASVLLLGAAATILSYLIGLTIGLIAGFRRSWVDPVLMRSIDVLLAFPALLLLLVLITALGNSIPVLLLGTVLILLPSISRVVRTVTQEVSVRGYVEASVARGERTMSILIRDIMPNIAHVLVADIGIRFGYAILVIASVNYLGFGLQPPSADWGLSISLNQAIIGINPWAVLAPAAPLAALTIGVNLIGDAYSHGRSQRRSQKRKTRAPRPVDQPEIVTVSA
jgi:peptide/nickel transport system permease protein